MKIAYVLPFPELNGGNKVISQHALLLRAAGHAVTVLGEGPRPDWFPAALAYRDLGDGGPPSGNQDLVIATYWTTVEVARGLAIGPIAHFCQGYEGDLEHLRPQLDAIRATYGWPAPVITVSQHLAERIQGEFGRACRVVPPPLDSRFRPRWRLAPRRHPLIVVPGIFEAAVKDVPTALRAVVRLRAGGIPCKLARVSILPLCSAERELLAPDRYLCGVPPERVAELLRSADLLLLPSRPGEGFGLPLLEAMASGLPAVASELPSTLAMTGGDAAELVPPGDDEAFARSARRLLESAGAWRRARRLGLLAARAFAPERIAPLLLDAIRWASEEASGSL